MTDTENIMVEMAKAEAELHTMDNQLEVCLNLKPIKGLLLYRFECRWMDKGQLNSVCGKAFQMSDTMAHGGIVLKDAMSSMVIVALAKMKLPPPLPPEGARLN
jgi:hypothetical protein